jgi:hypothetical protein
MQTGEPVILDNVTHVDNAETFSKILPSFGKSMEVFDKLSGGKPLS